MGRVCLLMFLQLYNTSKGTLESAAAVGQLQDSNISYVVSGSVANGSIKTTVIFFVLFLSIWISYCIKKLKSESEGE